MALKLPAALDADKELVDAPKRKPGALNSALSNGVASGPALFMRPTSTKPKPERIAAATEALAKFDRTTYQREYMKKWRAARKRATEVERK